MSDKILKFVLIFFINVTSFLVSAKDLSSDFILNNLSFPKVITSGGLKIVWWNIDCGLNSSQSKLKSNIKTTELEINLHALNNSPLKPDLLILGEYCPVYMSDKDKNKILKSYKYSFHLDRNIPLFKTESGRVNQRNGFLILSDLKFEVLKNEALYSNNTEQETKFNRQFLLLKLIKNNIEYYITPVHLVNPWRDLYSQNGFLRTVSEITYGSDNMNAIQIKNLVSKIEAYTNVSSRKVILGDFNSPGSISGFSGYGFKYMNSRFSNLNPGHEITFLGDEPFPETDLDHAFGLNVSRLDSAVLPLKGSRHLPIYLIID